MLDDISDFARTGVTLIIVVILIGLPAMFITGTVSLEQGVITLQQGIEQVEQQEHVNSTDTKPIVSTANKVKDEVKDIVVNGDYVENLTTIVNEAEKNSYVLPITLAIVLSEEIKSTSSLHKLPFFNKVKLLWIYILLTTSSLL